MKVSQFKSLIKEAVKEAVREVLSEQETTPIPAPVQEHVNYRPQPSIIEEDIADPIQAMINETKSRMTPEEYKDVLNMTSMNAPNFTMQSNASSMGVPSSGPEPGIDISNLDFIKKASSVLKAAEQKDRQKYGLPTA